MGKGPRHGVHRPGTASVGAYVPLDVRARLRAAAARDGVTLAEYVRRLLVRWAADKGAEMDD